VSGVLAVQRESTLHWRLFSAGDQAAAAVVRERTPPRSVFLTAPLHNHPVMGLAGRATVLGFPGWLWTHGYPYREREADVRTMYAGGGEALALLQRYGVDYVFIGPGERQLAADAAWFERSFPVVHRDREFTIYDVRRPPR
jgi:uncharacterized membrane protein